MRDIICRGKCSIHREKYSIGEWVEGVYIRIPKGRFEEEEYLIQPIKRNGKLGMLENVNPATVGQYTGLTDKHKAKVFEGDILLFHFEDIGDQRATVVWADKYASFLLRPFGNFEFARIEDGEVVGNIYDNPELMTRHEEAHHGQAED